MYGRTVRSFSVAMLVAVACMAGSDRDSSSDGPPPPPPPAPPVPTVPAGGGAGAAGTNNVVDATRPGKGSRILVSAGMDSVFVEDIVEAGGPILQSLIESPRSKDHLTLASGDSLLLDGNTPEGIYDLSDGTRLTLGPPRGYPRVFTIRPKPHPVLVFYASSRRRIGVLVASEQTGAFKEQSSIALAELFRTKAQYRSSKVRESEPLAFALPLDWYRRAEIELPDPPKNCRVLFFGYGDLGDAPQSQPIRSFGSVQVTPKSLPVRPGVALPSTGKIELIGEVRLVAGGPAIMRVESTR